MIFNIFFYFTEMSTTQGKLFKLVEFSEERIGNKKSVEIVSPSLITYDDKLGRLLCYFMPVPSGGVYEKEHIQLIKEIVKKNVAAPGSWSKYLISIRGEAST